MQTELMQEGWYWHRASDRHKWGCVEVFREDGHWWWSPQRELYDNNYAMENHSTEEWVYIGTNPSELNRSRSTTATAVEPENWYCLYCAIDVAGTMDKCPRCLDAKADCID